MPSSSHILVTSFLFFCNLLGCVIFCTMFSVCNARDGQDEMKMNKLLRNILITSLPKTTKNKVTKMGWNSHSFQFNSPLKFKMVIYKVNIFDLVFIMRLHLAMVTVSYVLQTRWNRFLKSILQMLTGILLVLYKKIRVLLGIRNQRKNNTNCSKSDGNLEKPHIHSQEYIIVLIWLLSMHQTKPNNQIEFIHLFHLKWTFKFLEKYVPSKDYSQL